MFKYGIAVSDDLQVEVSLANANDFVREKDFEILKRVNNFLKRKKSHLTVQKYQLHKQVPKTISSSLFQVTRATSFFFFHFGCLQYAVTI